MEFQIKLNKIKLNPQGGCGGVLEKLKKSKAVDNLAKSDKKPSKINTSGFKKSHNLKHSEVAGPKAFRQDYLASLAKKGVKSAEVRLVQVAQRQRKSVKSADSPVSQAGKQTASGGGKACSGSAKQRGLAIFKRDFPDGVGSLAEMREAIKHYNLKPFCAGGQMSNDLERVQSANGQWQDFTGGLKAIELRNKR